MKFVLQVKNPTLDVLAEIVQWLKDLADSYSVEISVEENVPEEPRKLDDPIEEPLQF